MKILLITEWFPPVKGAGAKRTRMMAEILQAQGHQVTVLTSLPSYPTGILPAEYRWKLWCRENLKGLDVLRIYEYPTKNIGIFKRILRELSFCLSSLLATIILAPYDAVIVSSPSFLSGLAGLFAARKTKLYFDIRDLWPDSLVDLKILSKNGFLIRILEKLERKYYQKATKITVAAPFFQQHLISEGIPDKKVILMINCADTNIFRPRIINRSNFGFKNDDFICLYLGNHAKLYDLKNVLYAAQILKKYPKIKFLLVGEGEEKEDLIHLTKKLNLTKVIFWPEKTYKEIPKIINLADVTLMTNLPKNIVPSKASEYLSSGKPVIASTGGYSKQILEDYQAGLTYPAGDPQALTKIILKLYRNNNLKRTMGRNARKLALEVFSKKIFERKLNHLFTD